MNAPFISIVIAAGRPDLTETVQSLRGQDYPVSQFEVLVVSEREDLTVPRLKNLRFIPCPTRNPAIKRNLGVSQAQGEIVAFIDDDAVAPPSWLMSGVQLLTGRPECAGVGGANLSPPGAPFAEKLTDAILNLPLIGSGTGAYRASAGTSVARAGDVHLVNMFVRKSVYLECGGLNESVGYGGEDTEFIVWVESVMCMRFLFSGELFVYHYRRPFGAAYIKQRFLLRVNNGRLFVARPSIYAKNFSFWGLLIGPIALAVTMLISPPVAFGALAAYLIVVTGISLWAQPVMSVILPLAVVIHHFTYAGGIYCGLISALTRWDTIRAIRVRKRVELQ